MDSIVKMKVAEAIADERDKYRKTENELVRTKNILRVSPQLFANFTLLGSRKKV